MTLKKIRLHILLVVFTATLTLTGCKPEAIVIPESPIFAGRNFASPLTGKIVDRVNLVKKVVKDTVIQLAPGVKQVNINYLDYSDKPMALYLLEVDLNTPGIALKTGTPNNSTAYGKKTVAEIAKAQDTVGNRVLAAVNGDYFNTTTGEPQSILFKNGVAIKPLYRLCALCTFLSIDNAGIPTIVSKDRVIDSTKIREAVGGYHWLVRDSVRISQGDASIEPRTGVGVSGKVVYFVMVDGRQATWSNGMSFAQISNVFYALGVKDAINLDGGGSTTLVVKEGADWVVKNKPSDGTPRAVANAWTIVSTQ